jgi:hypothetical protein
VGFCFVLLSVLRFEFRAESLLGKLSSTWATPPPLFCALVISQIGSHTFSPGPASDHDKPAYASHIAGITDVHL